MTTYKILDTRTKEIAHTGLTLDQARRVCILRRYFIFLPE